MSVVLISAKAQSVFLTKYLPQNPTLFNELKAPVNYKRCIVLKDIINYDKVFTDTISIANYDKDGREIDQIFFSSSGKRQSHYFSEYPNQNTKRFYSISKGFNNMIIRNYDEIIKDDFGNFLDARMYQVTNKGDTFIINDHDYIYDENKQIIYQCDMCNQSNPIKRYFKYNGISLVKFYETNKDTLTNFKIYNLNYTSNGRVSRYSCHQIINSDTEILQDNIYKYDKNILVNQLQFNYFEKVWREFIYQYDSKNKISKSFEIIGNDTTVTAYYYKGDKLIRSFLSTTFQYSDGIVLFGDKFRESFDDKIHTTEIKYKYDKHGRIISKEQYWDGELKKINRYIFE